MPDSARLVGSSPALAAAEFGATAWTTAPRFTLSCLATASDEICVSLCMCSWSCDGRPGTAHMHTQGDKTRAGNL